MRTVSRMVLLVVLLLLVSGVANATDLIWSTGSVPAGLVASRDGVVAVAQGYSYVKLDGVTGSAIGSPVSNDSPITDLAVGSASVGSPVYTLHYRSGQLHISKDGGTPVPVNSAVEAEPLGLLWVIQSGRPQSRGIKVDADGNVYVCYVYLIMNWEDYSFTCHEAVTRYAPDLSDPVKIIDQQTLFNPDVYGYGNGGVLLEMDVTPDGCVYLFRDKTRCTDGTDNGWIYEWYIEKWQPTNSVYPLTPATTGPLTEGPYDPNSGPGNFAVSPSGTMYVAWGVNDPWPGVGSDLGITTITPGGTQASHLFRSSASGRFGGTARIEATSDDAIFVCGAEWTPNFYQKDGFVMRLSFNGTTLSTAYSTNVGQSCACLSPVGPNSSDVYVTDSSASTAFRLHTGDL